MIRILHVVGRMDRGGTESMLMTHYRHIEKDKVQFDFVVHTTEPCDFDDEIQRLGGRIYHICRFNVMNIVAYRRDWHHLFQAHPEYKIIHVHHFLVAGIVLPIATKYGVPIRIAHSHNTRPPIFILKEKIMWIFHGNMIRYATKYLACSKSAGQYLFGHKPFMVFPNAIEIDAFRFDQNKRINIRREFGFGQNDFVIGHVGSFRTKQKNQSFIVDVFANVVKICANARLLFVGVGDLQKDIKEKVQSLGIDNKCVFANSRDDISAVMSAMDVFLFPSFFEGLGIVLIEAQASGLPCVVSTAIPQEACITPLVNSLSLNDSIDYWTEAVIKTRCQTNRFAYYADMKASSYDVERNVKLLKQIYGIV